MSEIQPWWQLAQHAIKRSDWPMAEGALRRLLLLAPGNPELMDLLSYALLMQADFMACELVLRDALAQGSRSFWTPHKLGDALRGQQRMDEAVAAYEQALSWGSDSPLTARNLLQVLDGLDPGLPLDRLEVWASSIDSASLNWELPPPWLAGACEAALTSTGLELAHWLQSRGCPDPAIRQRALQDSVLRFDLDRGLALAEGPLRQRLLELLSVPAPLELA
jgi:hypothetical protein